MRGFIDRVLLVVAVVCGGLVPGFIAQYRQRLGGRLDQARSDLAPWQQIADRNHHGDLQQLIQYHLKSSDSTFHAEGEAIRSMLSALEHLQAAVEGLKGSLFMQLRYLVVHLDPTLTQATLRDWVPTFSLSAEGLIFAGLFALLVWLAFQGLCSALAYATRPASRPSVARAQPEPVRQIKVRREPTLK